MASIARDKNGRKRILYFNADGERKSIRLGKMAVKQAETVKTHIEYLVAAITTGTAPDPKTANWVAELGDDLHAKLAGHGLVVPRDIAGSAGRVELATFVDSYIAMRTDVKPATVINWGHTRRNLVEFFGANKPIGEVTPGCADEWRLSLAAKKLADGTIRKRCGNAKQFFASAVRKRLIPSNPFADLPSNVRGNRERDHFVSHEVAQRVLAACPDAEWRLLFALSRYGGLRCPSEHLALNWDGVDWERGRMLVPSPKTERHENKGSRWIPIFPGKRSVNTVPKLRAILYCGIFFCSTGAITMGRRRKDRELYWRGILQQQAESGLGVAVFCRQASVSAPSFYAWRRKLKERDIAPRQEDIAPRQEDVAPRQEDIAPRQENPLVNAKAISAAQLLPVHIESSAPPAPVRILLPQGVSIETTGTIDVGVLANLLRAVREADRC